MRKQVWREVIVSSCFSLIFLFFAFGEWRYLNLVEKSRDYSETGSIVEVYRGWRLKPILSEAGLLEYNEGLSLAKKIEEMASGKREGDIRGVFSEILGIWQKALATDDLRLKADISYNTANIYVMAGNFELAVTNYLGALKLNPSHLRAKFNLERLFFQGKIMEKEKGTPAKIPGSDQGDKEEEKGDGGQAGKGEAGSGI